MKHSRQHHVAKLTKWYSMAEECTTRKQAKKAIKKTKKHARRLSELYHMESSSETDGFHDPAEPSVTHAGHEEASDS
ncbi:MAG: hypothetical protein ACO24D_14845 [bacterium]